MDLYTFSSNVNPSSESDFPLSSRGVSVVSLIPTLTEKTLYPPRFGAL
jgi:hypothetical protein